MPEFDHQDVLWLEARVAALSEIVMRAKLVTPELLAECTQDWKEAIEDEPRAHAAREGEQLKTPRRPA